MMTWTKPVCSHDRVILLFFFLHLFFPFSSPPPQRLFCFVLCCCCCCCCGNAVLFPNFQFRVLETLSTAMHVSVITCRVGISPCLHLIAVFAGLFSSQTASQATCGERLYILWSRTVAFQTCIALRCKKKERKETLIFRV